MWDHPGQDAVHAFHNLHTRSRALHVPMEAKATSEVGISGQPTKLASALYTCVVTGGTTEASGAAQDFLPVILGRTCGGGMPLSLKSTSPPVLPAL